MLEQAFDLLTHALERFNEAMTLLEQLQGISAADARVELCEEEWRKVFSPETVHVAVNF